MDKDFDKLHEFVEIMKVSFHSQYAFRGSPGKRWERGQAPALEVSVTH